MLWAYKTTPYSTTEESPFRLTYRVQPVIKVEVKELSWRMTYPQIPKENEQLQGELALSGEEPYKVKIEQKLDKKNSIKPMEKP